MEARNRLAIISIPLTGLSAAAIGLAMTLMNQTNNLIDMYHLTGRATGVSIPAMLTIACAAGILGFVAVIIRQKIADMDRSNNGESIECS